METILCRLRDEAILFEKQVGHFVRLVEEYMTKYGLFASACGGLAVRLDGSIVSVETGMAVSKLNANAFVKDLVSRVLFRLQSVAGGHF